MTMAIKKAMNAPDSANLSPPPHSAVGLYFVLFSRVPPPPPPSLGNVMKEGGVAQAMYKYSDSLLAINGSQSALLSVWLWLLLSAVNCSSDLWNSIQASSSLTSTPSKDHTVTRHAG